MNRQTTINDDQLVFRTKGMEMAQALRFAKCLANNPKFSEVWIIPRSDGSAYVAYKPTNEMRQIAIAREFQHKRETTAQTESGGYQWTPRATGIYACYNPKSGNTYTCSASHCTCADFQSRGFRLCLPCKHILALRNMLAEVNHV